MKDSISADRKSVYILNKSRRFYSGLFAVLAPSRSVTPIKASSSCIAPMRATNMNSHSHLSQDIKYDLVLQFNFTGLIQIIHHLQGYDLVLLHYSSISTNGYKRVFICLCEPCFGFQASFLVYILAEILFDVGFL